MVAFVDGKPGLMFFLFAGELGLSFVNMAGSEDVGEKNGGDQTMINTVVVVIGKGVIFAQLFFLRRESL